ncbi:L-idonate 5-dehydrogenase [Saccharomonospora azurea]|uniref:Theronine dehydrogenase-like Zn-dependent dehydrogenase n=1 Tax=Saccharomonospora azurea NA-128 TaxID=882081 RepID=H8GB26_9PSEU|nr:L-idonate 5-dehydrogenase [Saccharomonospora azurea]EHY89682.1 theronine dehydrogenase-like Zn-dependent dehydrogenase [Saccharomonospora azurea NA-128]
MRSLFIHGAEDMRFEDVAMPEPGEGEVLLRVRYVGICGSDLHYYFHGKNGENLVREPFTPGHELSATVEADPSEEWAPGTPVTVHPARYGTPVERIADRPHLWPGGDYLGSAANLPHRQGAAAEYVVVEKHMLRGLPDGLSLRDAALAEPLGVALHALTVARDGAGDLGDRALVLGAGPIGLLVVAALTARGVEHVAVGDIQESALARARALGAHEAFLVGTDEIPTTAYPVVFECSAAPASLTQAIASAAHAGVVVQVGMLADTTIGVNLAPLVSKEVQLRGTFRFSTEIDEAVDLLAANPSISQVVTHVLPATEAVTAFETARDSASSSKVLIEF